MTITDLSSHAWAGDDKWQPSGLPQRRCSRCWILMVMDGLQRAVLAFIDHEQAMNALFSLHAEEEDHNVIQTERPVPLALRIAVMLAKPVFKGARP
ncbi:MAG: hypothetical protein QM742_04215 [Aquabacterium sp.]